MVSTLLFCQNLFSFGCFVFGELRTHCLETSLSSKAVWYLCSCTRALLLFAAMLFKYGQTEAIFRTLPCRLPHLPPPTRSSSHTFLLTARSNAGALSHLQAASCGVMLVQAPPENHLCFISSTPPPHPWGPERCRQHFVPLQGSGSNLALVFVSLISLTLSCFAGRCTFGAVLIISKNTFSTKALKQKE